MALLIHGIKVDEVPDDRAPEIINCPPQFFRSDDPGEKAINVELSVERPDPITLNRYKPQTVEDMRAGIPPEVETLKLYMSDQVADALTWHKDVWDFMRDEIESQRRSMEVKDSLTRMRTLDIENLKSYYLQQPWWKRIWRVLWRKL